MNGPSALADEPAAPGKTAPALALAGVAALLSSTCCVGPLVLAIVGISGTWIGQLRRMEPYSEALTAVAVVALLLAAQRIYRPARAGEVCEPGSACERTRPAVRRWFWAMAALTLLPWVVRAAAPLFY